MFINDDFDFLRDVAKLCTEYKFSLSCFCFPSECLWSLITYTMHKVLTGADAFNTALVIHCCATVQTTHEACRGSCAPDVGSSE